MSQVYPRLVASCEVFGVVPTIVDLRWGVTAQQVRSMDSLTRCLDEVLHSDIFICLIGHRYGWHVSSAAKADENKLLIDSGRRAARALHLEWVESAVQRLSVTEMELRCAQRMINPAHIHLVVRDTEDPKFVESCPVGKRQLQALRQEFATVAQHYTSCSSRDGTSQLVDIIIDAIGASMSKLFAGSVKPTKWIREKNIQRSRMHQLLKGYVPPEAAVKQVATGLSKGDVILITGEKGVGKSSIAAFTANEIIARRLLAEASELRSTFYHFAGCTADSCNAAKLIRRLLLELDALVDPNVDLGDDDMATLLCTTLAPQATKDQSKRGGGSVSHSSSKAAAQPHHVIVIDGLEMIEGSNPGSLLLRLPLNSAVNTRWIFTVASASSASAQLLLKTAANAVSINLVGAQTDDDIRKRLHGKLQAEGKSFTELQMANALQQGRLALQNPLFTTLFVQELCCGASFDTLDATVGHLLSTCSSVAQLVFAMIHRLETQFTSQHVQLILTAIFFAKIGLSESDLVAACHVPAATVFALFRNLHCLFIDRAGILVADDVLRTAISQRYFSSQSSLDRCKQESHELLSTFYLTCPVDGRVIVEATWHLSEARQWQRLGEFLATPAVLKEMYCGFKRTEYSKLWETVLQSLPSSPASGGEPAVDLASFFKLDDTHSLDDALLISRFFASIGKFASVCRVLRRALPIAVKDRKDLLAEVQIRLAAALVSSGELAEGFKLAQAAAQNGTTTASDLLQILGRCYKKQGLYTEAATFYKRAVQAAEAASRDVSSSVGATKNTALLRVAAAQDEYGAVLRKQGLFSDAHTVVSQAIETKTKILGAVHPSVANSQLELASILKKIGRHAQALELLRVALTTARSFSLEHPLIAPILVMTGHCQRKLSDYSGSLRAYEEGAALYTKLLGPDHVDTLETRSYIALAKKKQGLYPEAGVILLDALNRMRRVLPPYHPKIAAMLIQQADVDRKLGNLTLATERVEEARAMFVKAYGEDHVETADADIALIQIELLQSDKLDDVIRRSKSALDVFTRHLGRDHEKVMTALMYLGDGYVQVGGEMLRAREQYEGAIEVATKVFGEQHVETCELFFKLGRLFKKLHWYSDASRCFISAIEGLQEKLGSDEHPKVASAQINLADVYRKQGKTSEAFVLYRRAIVTCETFGLDGDIAECKNGLGMCHLANEDFAEAERLIRESIALTTHAGHKKNRLRNFNQIAATIKRLLEK